MPLTVHTIIALLFCIAGLLCYALATSPKVVELGRLSFFAGLLVTLFAVGASRVSLG